MGAAITMTKQLHIRSFSPNWPEAIIPLTPLHFCLGSSMAMSQSVQSPVVPKLYQFSSGVGGKLVQVPFSKSSLSLLTAGNDGHHLSFLIDEYDLFSPPEESHFHGILQTRCHCMLFTSCTIICCCYWWLGCLH